MKSKLRIFYSIILIIGIIFALFLFFETKKTCINSEKVCLVYHYNWKKIKAPTSKAIKLQHTKPEAYFQVVVTDSKTAGGIQAVATSLNQELSKQIKSYHLLESNRVVVDKKLSVEMQYEFTTNAGNLMHQALVITSLGDRTYYFTTQATSSNYDKVKKEFDYILSHVEIKK